MEYFGFFTLNIIGTLYAIDSYPMWAGSVLILISAIRNIASFGIGYGVQPFIEARGVQITMGTFAGIIGGIGVMGIPVYICGKLIRKFTVRVARVS